MKRALAPAAIALFALAVPANASATNPIAIKSFDVDRTTTQAGAHPDLDIKIDFCDPPHSGGGPVCFPTPNGDEEQLKDWIVRTPPGLLGNPLNAEYCEYVDYLLANCPENSQVGQVNLSGLAFFSGFESLQEGVRDHGNGGIYNLRPLGSEAARFGATVYSGANEFLPISQESIFTVRTNGDFGLTSLTPNFVNQVNLAGQFFPVKIRNLDLTFFGHIDGKPFLTNPTQCNPGAFETEAASYQAPGVFASASAPFTSTGCDQVPFDPRVTVDRETSKAGAPSGYTIGVEFDDSENDPIHESHLKNAEVTLPKGTVLAPAAAGDLDGCTDTQFGYGSDAAVSCPAGSRIGDVKVFTPLVDPDLSTPATDPLEGKVFFATPTAADPWRIFLLIEGAGLRIKLRGKVDVDDNTGQVKTTFLDNPQTPFTKFELTLRGGDQAILENPVECGTHTIEAKFTPWSDPADPVTRHADFNTTGDGAGGSCPSPRPFAPATDASTSPTDAGASTTSRLLVTRAHGDQMLKNFHLSLPPGLVGSLATVPLCAPGDATAGNCSADAKIGSVQADVGGGNSPIRVAGEVFLAKPLHPGDAAGLSIVVPAKTGPIDLGKVVTTSRVLLRNSDGGIDVQTGDLPSIFKGIELSLRRIEVLVDREGFFQNPTSCEPRTLVADFAAYGGGASQSKVTASATNCERLSFSPRLEMSLSGETHKNGHPALKAVVTQAPGESAIKQAQVLLPQVLRPDVPVLNRPGKLCSSAQLASNSCPAPSQLGTARVHTPLLPEPLTGPVYIIQDPDPANPLPRLVVRLGGMVSIDLIAQNKIAGVRTLNIFDSVPDVPQSRFELDIVGGKEGILKNFVDICESPDHADATFTGHSGKVFKESPQVTIAGCKGGVRFSGKSIRVSRSGVAPVKLGCSAAGPNCAGTLSVARLGRKAFSIEAGKAATVRVKLKRRAVRRLNRGKRISVTATVTPRAGVKIAKVSSKLSLRGMSKRRS